MKIRIPSSFPVRPISADSPDAKDIATCGTCGLSWDDGIATQKAALRELNRRGLWLGEDQKKEAGL